MRGLRVGSLFSGIGALDIAVHNLLPDSETVWFVEQNDFCQKLLRKRFPDALIYNDVREVSRDNLAPIDILVGGFPCQDISTAGQGAGISKETRSGLFFEMWRIAQELQPRVVLFENVPAITIRGLDTVAEIICSSGWTIEWFALSASDVGAWHRRERWWGIAHREPQPLFGQYETIGELQDGWRTLQQGLFGSPSIIERMPRSGMVRDGLLYERPQSKISSGWFNTPNTMDHLPRREGEAMERCLSRGEGGSKRDRSGNLREDKRLCYPTPTVSDYKDSNTEHDVRYQVKRRGANARLGTVVSARMNGLLPTPVRNDGHDHRSEVKEQEWLPGKLNPDWVEPLMGLPSGYTDLERDIAPYMIEVSSWKDGSWEEDLPRLTDKKDNRVSRIQSLGNSVVPQCAFEAYSIIREILKGELCD